MNIAVRADGGSTIGFGHLIRSNVLSTYFLQKGHKVTYLTKTPTAVNDVCSSGIDIFSLESQNSLEDTVSWLEDTRPAVVVSDCYDIDTAAQEAISALTNCFAVVQADNRHELRCDMLVNGHLFAQDIEYRWRGSEPIWCVGLEYLLLQEKFRELAKQSSKWRSPPETALITMGGSDVTNMTPTAIRAFDGLDIEVDVIIGPGFDNWDQISKAVSGVSCQFNLIENPPHLYDRMANADFAVSGFGTTVYELIASGTPFVGIPVVENQEQTAFAFEKEELAEVVKPHENLRRSVYELFENTNYRQRLHNSYDTLVDGDGVNRVYRDIMRSVADTN